MVEAGRNDGGAVERDRDKKRVCLNCRLTEHERRVIGERAAALGLTVTEYVVARCVYDRETWLADPGELELLKGVNAELKAQGRNINQIARAAQKIALNTRSRASIDLGRALKSMADALTPEMVQCVTAVSTAIGSAHPRRRR